MRGSGGHFPIQNRLKIRFQHVVGLDLTADFSQCVERSHAAPATTARRRTRASQGCQCGLKTGHAAIQAITGAGGSGGEPLYSVMSGAAGEV